MKCLQMPYVWLLILASIVYSTASSKLKFLTVF